jgi:hypothetical protein
LPASCNPRIGLQIACTIRPSKQGGSQITNMSLFRYWIQQVSAWDDF